MARKGDAMEVDIEHADATEPAKRRFVGETTQ
jgi:hypothetical protein